MSCRRIWLLHSRSRSQQRFKVSVSICPDNIFWTTEHLVTRLGMMMQHCEPECHAKEICLPSLRSRSQWGLIGSNYFFHYIFWTADSSAAELGLMIHHHQPECLVKKKELLYLRSRSQRRVEMFMFVQVISSKVPNILLLNLVLWCIIMSQSVTQKDRFAIYKVMVRARAHDQTMTVSTISSELLILWLP